MAGLVCNVGASATTRTLIQLCGLQVRPIAIQYTITLQNKQD